jgi:thioredoxin reductase (NADPH)
MLLETSLPGVFAAGDVRFRSVKRVASAVGEGAIAVQLVHDYLAEQPTEPAARAKESNPSASESRTRRRGGVDLPVPRAEL